MRRNGTGSWRLAALAAALLPLAAAALTPARTWSLVDLGTLGGSGSYATALSNAGEVVGCAETASGEVHAFSHANGSMRDLGAGCALAVNSEGLIAGRNGAGELVVWSGAAVRSLQVSGDVGAIDARGVVVGAYRDGATTFAFKFEEGALKTLAANAAATGINMRGQITGTVNGRAVVFEDGAVRDLGTLGGNASSARGLNDRGEIVGMSSDANAQPHAFLYDGAMRALPAPGYSGAVAINNGGQVVGSAEGSYGYLIEGDTCTRLDTLPAVAAKGWRKLEPKAINDRGWIAGTATTASGDFRAFLLVPAEGRAPVAALARQGRAPY